MEPQYTVPTSATAARTSNRDAQEFPDDDAADLTTMTASEIIAWYAAFKLTNAERHKRAARH